ncbi:universal stress protein [Gelatiniphilus marinus]|uniref:Universal stress protein n=1 Tax=Gelatiniphilus marinus TaxID=1759464 RepID=A0ABW5JV27_9FLAO
MKILEKVLFAQDFNSSKNLESAAIDIAKTFNSKLIPIHVLPDDLLDSKVKDKVGESALAHLQKTSDGLKKHGVEVDAPLIRYGSPHEAIVKAAVAVNANLILAGSGAHPEDGKFLLGTTTQRIIQNSDKPVLVIKENTNLNIKTILCPVDFSDSSERALNNAIVMARRYNAELVVLSVCEKQTSSWFGSQEYLDKENKVRFEKHATDYETFLKKFNLVDVNFTKESKMGNPAQEILKTVASKKIDLMVMGTHGRTGLNRMIMGSVTEKVIREVPCSFVTLKSEDVINLQLQSDIKDFEKLFEEGIQLAKDGFYEEAIEQFKASLNINNMHVPAYEAIAKVFEKMEAPKKAAMYRKSAKEIKNRMWYSKIEEEVRKLRSS